MKIDIDGYEFGAGGEAAAPDPDGDPRGDVTRWSIHATAKAAESVFFGRLGSSIEYFMMFDEMFDVRRDVWA